MELSILIVGHFKDIFLKGHQMSILATEAAQRYACFKKNIVFFLYVLFRYDI